MKIRLSIIIPCYNCKATLEESLSSVFQQGLSVPFEVIMVDDGSTDGTRNLIKELKDKYPNTRYVFHDKNRGGGAARNTGIKESEGELIFCLDSDNFFAPDTLQGMIDYLQRTDADGVLIDDRRFFVGNDVRHYTSHINKRVDGGIKIENLFDDTDILLDNFLFTKRSFLAAGGYPEHHGFDTQSFEVRYLARLPKVFVSPGSVFYHRQDPGKNSYFQRVYKNGEFSKNFYLIYEDALWLFSDKVRMEILSYDIFANSKLGEDNIKSRMNKLFADDKDGFFIKDKERYMVEGGFRDFCESRKESVAPADRFALAVYAYQEQGYSEALRQYEFLLAKGIDTKVVYFNILRCGTGLSAKYDQPSIEKRVIELAAELVPIRRKIARTPAFFISLLNNFPKMKQLIKKILNHD